MKPSELSAHLRRIAAKIDNSTKPDKSLVTKELRRVLASLRVASPQADWEMKFYGETGPLPKEEQGSQMFWHAFTELGWNDWTPVSDPKVVEAKIREMYAVPGKFLGDVEYAVKDMHVNYNSYKKHYESKYMSGEVGKGTIAKNV